MALLQAALWVLAVCVCLIRADGGFYSLSAVDIEGNEVQLEKYKGKVSLVVNVASRCGYTEGNYRELVRLQAALEPHGFNVLAFPSNQFLRQEPASNKEILMFAQKTYNVNFPLFSKVDVRGEEADQVYQFLTRQTGSVPMWNFNKYLVDKDGSVVQFFTQDDKFDVVRRSVEYLLNKHTEL